MTETHLTPRQRARQAFISDLVTTGRRHLRREGVAALSLRAVARDLGVSSSAVYRYVSSRDDLLTLLIIDAYDRVGQRCETAEVAAVDEGMPPGEIWPRVAAAFREWAREDRNSFELIYGTPVAGYAAPEETVAPASRLWGVIARTLARAEAGTTLDPYPGHVPEGIVEPDVVETATELVAAIDAPPPSEVDILRAVTLFSSLVGSVTAELFGHLRGFTTDPAVAFQLSVGAAAAGAGLRR